jgi:hypothetical protein
MSITKLLYNYSQHPEKILEYKLFYIFFGHCEDILTAISVFFILTLYEVSNMLIIQAFF